MIIVVESNINKTISAYMAEMGRKGGRKSRRTLNPETAQKMTQVREARRYFKKYYAQCFWSFDPAYIIKENDIPWVSEQLKKNGDRKLWMLGVKLCR